MERKEKSELRFSKKVSPIEAGYLIVSYIAQGYSVSYNPKTEMLRVKIDMYDTGGKKND